jgi:t-SNARE complex subunit (syntaxin)
MEPNGKDVLIEEIDRELRAIDAKLNKVLSKTDALLKESTDEIKEAEKTDMDDGGQASQAKAENAKGSN